MQKTPNVVRPSPVGDAVLSQSAPQQAGDLPAIEFDPFDQAQHHPHVRQHGRARQTPLVQHYLFQPQFGLLRQRIDRPGRRGSWRRWRRTRDGRGDVFPAVIEALLLLLARGRLIVGHTSLARTLPTMVVSAAKGTTQVPTTGVPGMSQKLNPAATAGHDATLPFGMGLKERGQRDLILLNNRLGAIVLGPIRPKQEDLLERDDKKAKVSATIETVLCTPSSYLTEAQASTSRARFFYATKRTRN